MSSSGSEEILAPNRTPHPYVHPLHHPAGPLATQYTSTDQQQQQQQQQQPQDSATVCNGSAVDNGRALYSEQHHQQHPPGKSPNTLLLHCCCVIVQITPVAPGRSHVTTTASAKKPTIGDDGGGGGGGSGGGGGASGRTPVCRCNTQYKLQDLKALTSQKQQKQQSLASSNVQSSSTSAINAIGTAPLQGILSKSSTTGHRQHQPLQQQHSSQSLAYSSSTGQQQLPPPPPPRQSQELTNEELIKFLQQINADIKWIEQLQQYKYEIEKSTSTDKTNARNINKPTVAPVQLPLANGHLGKPKSEPMLPSVAAAGAGPCTGAISKTEFFDRNLKQRHSSRSVDASTARRDEEEYGKEGAGGNGHQRHSSGPSDLQLLKSDISEWLLNLPLKKSVEFLQKAKNAQLKYEKEQELQMQLQQLAKKPLQRQMSGGASERGVSQQQQQQQQQPPPPAEIALTRDDILEWLKKQQIFSKVNEETSATKKCKDKEELTLHHYDPSRSGRSALPGAPMPGTSSSTAKLLKRHSLGPNEEFFHKQTTTDWIQYPLRQLKKHTFDPTQSSCTDVRRKEVHTDHGHRERKLRHSASEVVTSSQSDLPIHSQSQARVAPQKPERTFRYHSRDRAPAHVSTTTSTVRQHSMPQIPFHQQQQHHFQYPASQLQQPQPSTSTFVPQAPSKPAKKERSRRHRTQRSATVGDINQFNKPTVGTTYHKGGGLGGSSMPHGTSHARSAERSASLTRCADPSCSVMSLCDDPNCYMFGGGKSMATTAAPTTSYYDTPRCASLPRVLPKSTPKCGPMCYECNNKCNSLPRCTDARCQIGATPIGGPSAKAKSNSLPRNAENYMYPPQPSHQPLPQPALRGAGRLSREESRCSLPRSSFKSSKKRSASASGSGSNGSKLTKSLSAASLNSRRRRHKTVHFGENLLREVCQNRKLIQPLQETPSGSAPLQPNIQMLYNFVEGVLSAWVDDEDDPNKSGPESEPERGAILKPMHRCNRARFQTIRRVVNEAAELKGSSKLGNSRYRHRHWRGTAKDCNERFLRKVGCPEGTKNYIEIVCD
uniref:Uncharacterized protein n=1 Tax=Anopheles stephensi TaxID=30069 RepID=A0A182Y2L7_ANOST